MEGFRRRLLAIVERTCWTLGLAALVVFGLSRLGLARSTERELDRFATLQALAKTEVHDQSLWSATRVTAWQRLANESFPAPLAVLRIPKIHVEVPVLPGTDDRTLDRGVGHIEDTAVPGTDGNSGLAGHRDSFFRGLKDMAIGDEIELDTLDRTEVYRIERTWIVEPEDVSVLDPTPVRALTLVTCYPFYFVGSAPQRFIVRAVLASSRPVNGSR